MLQLKGSDNLAEHIRCKLRIHIMNDEKLVPQAAEIITEAEFNFLTDLKTVLSKGLRVIRKQGSSRYALKKWTKNDGGRKGSIWANQQKQNLPFLCDIVLLVVDLLTQVMKCFKSVPRIKKNDERRRNLLVAKIKGDLEDKLRTKGECMRSREILSCQILSTKNKPNEEFNWTGTKN